MTGAVRKTRFSLCPEDRDRYGGPEWVTFDPDALCRMPGTALTEIEEATGFLIAWLWVQHRRASSLGQRVAIWIARRQAGLVDDFEKFDPMVWHPDSRHELVDEQPAPGGDADPPAPGSPPGSPDGP